MRRYDGRTQVGSVLKDSHIKPSPAIGSIVSIRPSHPTSALARPDAPHLNRSNAPDDPPGAFPAIISLIYIYIIKLYWCCSAGPLFCLFVVVVVVVVGCCVGACFFLVAVFCFGSFLFFGEWNLSLGSGSASEAPRSTLGSTRLELEGTMFPNTPTLAKWWQIFKHIASIAWHQFNSFF